MKVPDAGQKGVSIAARPIQDVSNEVGDRPITNSKENDIPKRLMESHLKHKVQVMERELAQSRQTVRSLAREINRRKEETAKGAGSGTMNRSLFHRWTKESSSALGAQSAISHLLVKERVEVARNKLLREEVEDLRNEQEALAQSWQSERTELGSTLRRLLAAVICLCEQSRCDVGNARLVVLKGSHDVHVETIGLRAHAMSNQEEEESPGDARKFECLNSQDNAQDFRVWNEKAEETMAALPADMEMLAAIARQAVENCQQIFCSQGKLKSMAKSHELQYVKALKQLEMVRSHVEQEQQRSEALLKELQLTNEKLETEVNQRQVLEQSLSSALDNHAAFKQQLERELIATRRAADLELQHHIRAAQEQREHLIFQQLKELEYLQAAFCERDQQIQQLQAQKERKVTAGSEVTAESLGMGQTTKDQSAQLDAYCNVNGAVVMKASRKTAAEPLLQTCRSFTREEHGKEDPLMSTTTSSGKPAIASLSNRQTSVAANQDSYQALQAVLEHNTEQIDFHRWSNPPSMAKPPLTAGVVKCCDLVSPDMDAALLNVKGGDDSSLWQKVCRTAPSVASQIAAAKTTISCQ